MLRENGINLLGLNPREREAVLGIVLHTHAVRNPWNGQCFAGKKSPFVGRSLRRSEVEVHDYLVCWSFYFSTIAYRDMITNVFIPFIRKKRKSRWWGVALRHRKIKLIRRV